MEGEVRKYQIAIYRHAKAESSHDEMARPLTEEGVTQALKAVNNISKNWQTLLCSPALRTQQTGQYLTNLIPIIIDRLYTNHLPSTGEIEILYNELIPYTNNGHCFIVTHQPIILPLISRFAEREISSIEIKTCEGAIILEDGSIEWKHR